MGENAFAHHLFLLASARETEVVVLVEVERRRRWILLRVTSTTKKNKLSPKESARRKKKSARCSRQVAVRVGACREKKGEHAGCTARGACMQVKKVKGNDVIAI
jgi:hypothetical protein